jgi:Domain of unknown function (DUF4129)
VVETDDPGVETMTRWWTAVLAAIDDVVPMHWVVVILLVLTTLVAFGWYAWPSWVPRRWPRFSWLRGLFGLSWVRTLARRLRRQRPAPPEEAVAEPAPTVGDLLPDLPAATFASLADAFAADGRYAEAVRERFRAIVRNLVERQVIDHHPGWTVTELAEAAAGARPAVHAPLTEAGTIFSRIWYGLVPARHDDDLRMRTLVLDTDHALDTGLVGKPMGGGGS